MPIRARFGVLAVWAAVVFSVVAVSAQQSAPAEKEPTRLLITRPVEVTTGQSPKFTWLMGLIDAYVRMRFSGRDEFELISYDDVAKAIPQYGATDKIIGEETWFKACKSLRAGLVLFHKYEYAEKEMTVQYYVELISLPDRRVVSSFEKVLQLRTIGVELDDAVLRLCDQLKLSPSESSTKFFEKPIISPDVAKMRSFGQTVAEEYYAKQPDYAKIARRYADLAKSSADMAICIWMAGRSFARQGQYVQALEMYRQFRERFPLYAPVHQALCESYRLNGQPAEAVEAARTARAQGFDALPILVEQLRGLDALGKKDEAYKIALEIHARRPDEPFALFFISRWRVSEGRFEEGLKLAEQLLAMEPNHGGALLEKGRALVGLNRPADAIMPLTQATVLLPKDPAPYIELGDIHYKRKDYAKAASYYAEACKYRSDDLELFLRTAESFEYAKQIPEAVKTLLAIEPKYPDDLRLNASLGLLQFAMKDTAGARFHLEKRIRSRVDDSLIFLTLGDIYIAAQEYMRAINVYEQALPLVKDKNRLRLRLASLFLIKKEPTNALTYLEQIVSENPSYPEVYRYFGDAYRDAGNLDKAIENYKRERDTRGDHPYLQEQIAALYFKQEKYKDAEAECHRLAKVDPRNAFAYYRLSIIALKNKNASLAEKFLNTALQLGEADEETYYRLGVGYAEMGRYDAAERSYKKCIEKNPQRYAAWAGLAEVQTKAGKDSIAAETYMTLARFEVDEYREASATAGRMFEKLGLTAKAVEAYNFYLGRRNVSEDINLRLARLEFANKNYEAVHRLLGNQYMKSQLSESDNRLLAESYMALKWYKDALPLLERAIATAPTDHRLIEQACTAAVALDELPKAIELHRKYLALPPTEKHPEYAYQLAGLLAKTKNLKEARAQLESNIQKYSLDMRNYEKLGSLCINQRDWDCAVSVLERAIKQPTVNQQIKQMLAALYERLGMQDKAVALYQTYLSEAPQDSLALLNAGTLYYNRREYAQAAELLKKAHQLMPQNFESAFMLGDSYRKLGKTQEAIAAFLEARRIRSKDRDVLSSLAKCYTELKDTRNLVPILRELLFLDDRDVEVKIQLAKVLLELHNTSEACRLLESVVRERPDDIEIRRLLAKTYQQTGDEEGFLRHVKEALAYAELKGDFYYDLGRYYLNKKRRDLALEYFGKAVEADPKLNAARAEYAQLLRETGNTLAAYREIQKAVELDPYNPQYLTLFSQVAYQMNKPEIAMDAIMRALEQDSTSVTALSWAGFLYNQRNATDTAKIYLEKAIARDPNCALCHEYMGDAYAYEANYAKAAIHYEKSQAVRAYSEATSLKLAKAVLLSGQPEKAGLLLEKILVMNNACDEALYWLTHVYVTLGRAAEAANLPKTYKFTKKTGWLHLAQGEIYEAQDNINAALISFSVAARLMPDEPRSLAATGRMHLAKREYEEAVEYFGKALGKDPHNPQYLIELGKAYEGLTDYSSAIQLYEEVIRTNPHMTDAYYWVARALSKSGNHAKAVEMLTTGLRRKPTDQRMRLTLGHEYRAMGQFDKALKVYLALGDEEGATALEGLRFAGMVYYEDLKQPDKARKIFDRYVKAGGGDPSVRELLAKLQ